MLRLGIGVQQNGCLSLGLNKPTLEPELAANCHLRPQCSIKTQAYLMVVVLNIAPSGRFWSRLLTSCLPGRHVEFRCGSWATWLCCYLDMCACVCMCMCVHACVCVCSLFVQVWVTYCYIHSNGSRGNVNARTHTHVLRSGMNLNALFFLYSVVSSAEDPLMEFSITL